MGKSQDFENYDYNRFFAKLEKALGDGYETFYDSFEKTLQVLIDDMSITVKISLHDRVQVVCVIGAIENAGAYCREHTGFEEHLVFSENAGIVSIHVQIPLFLGQGWDDVVISSTVTVVKEIERYIEKTKAA